MPIGIHSGTEQTIYPQKCYLPSASGKRLLDRSDRLFHRWHRVRDGTLDRAGFASRAARLRKQVKEALGDGAAGPCATTATTCRELLRLEPFLWTFVRATCRLRGVGLLDHLTACFQAGLSGQRPPSLMPAKPPVTPAA